MITYLKIEGFKSIKFLEMELKPINILIGSNGAGKSNFISFIKLLSSIFNNRLQKYISEEKADNILYFGRKETEKMTGKIIFSEGGGYNNAYIFCLLQNREGGLFLEYEGSGFRVSPDDDKHNYFFQ